MKVQTKPNRKAKMKPETEKRGTVVLKKIAGVTCEVETFDNGFVDISINDPSTDIRWEWIVRKAPAESAELIASAVIGFRLTPTGEIMKDVPVMNESGEQERTVDIPVYNCVHHSFNKKQGMNYITFEKLGYGVRELFTLRHPSCA
jgi:hypothetical protein